MNTKIRRYELLPELKKEILITKKVQSVIDECSNAGGGEVVFTKGEYVLSTVFLKDNVSIKIEEGAVVLGSLNFDDYEFHEKVDYPIYQDASHTYFHCSLFVGINCKNIQISGNGIIDMRSVWDEENKRNIVHRGSKTIALKNCTNVKIEDLGIYNSTDLAVYFAGCENVEVQGLKMRVYIDGISPDNSKNVTIRNCQIECGDDGIVFKSSYTLGRMDICKNILVENCKVKSHCNALKFGTESLGGFEDITIRNIQVSDTRITGIAIESVDGAKIKNITIKDITMKNVGGAPLFIHIGKRLTAPVGQQIGSISDVTIENLTADGPYVPYEIIASNYNSFIKNYNYYIPWFYDMDEKTMTEKNVARNWHVTSNCCGLENHTIKNLKLKNVKLRLYGGVQEFNTDVPKDPKGYPEVYVYGYVLPAKGIYFRHVEGLILENVSVDTYKEDCREDFVFDTVSDCKIY